MTTEWKPVDDVEHQEQEGHHHKEKPEIYIFFNKVSRQLKKKPSYGNIRRFDPSGKVVKKLPHITNDFWNAPEQMYFMSLAN